MALSNFFGDFVGDAGALVDRQLSLPTRSLRHPAAPFVSPAEQMSDVGRLLGTDRLRDLPLADAQAPQQVGTPEVRTQPPAATGQPIVSMPSQSAEGQPPPKRDGGLRSFLGNLGDVILAGSGAKAIYGPKVAQEKFADALGRWMQNPSDAAAWQGMLSDPDHSKLALQIRAAHQRYQTGDIDQGGKLDERAMQVLGAAHDQASYDRARNVVAHLYRSVGRDPAGLGLPEQFSPDLAPEIRLRGSAPKDQLGDARMTRKLDWDIDDDEADNERADRNTDSLIEDRTGRRGETRRYNDVQSGNTRRGQDIRSRDTQRGQDRRPAGRSGGNVEPSATGPKGEKIFFRSGKWVDAQGRPVG